MAVYSMTGYASAQHEWAAEPGGSPIKASPSGRMGLEIRCVNSRYLDLAFRLPDELRHVEPALRELIHASIKRGKLEVRLTLAGDNGAQLPLPAARQLQRLTTLQDSVLAWLPTAAHLSVADVLRLSSLDSSSPTWTDAQVLDLAKRVLTDMMAAREREGARLVLMLQSHLLQLRRLAQLAQPLIPQLVEQQRQRFLDRWQEALAQADSAVAPEAAQDRALTEATAFAIRIDVAEELTRLQSHLDEITRMLTQGGALGKRLDFLIQELHREANTLGSKSSALELTRISVDMKVLIEQMREQVQNIE